LDRITGTVSASIADIDYVKRREGIEELFEDGTVSFLSIVSIRHGFKILSSLTVSAISRYIELYKYIKYPGFYKNLLPSYHLPFEVLVICDISLADHMTDLTCCLYFSSFNI